jgi:hypothetical protein
MYRRQRVDSTSRKLNVQCMNKYIIDCKFNSTKGVSCDSFDFPPGQMSVVTNRGPYIKLPWDVWVTVKTGALNKMRMLQKVCFCQSIYTLYSSLDSTCASNIDVTSEILVYTLLISSCNHIVFLKNDIHVTVMNVEPLHFDRIRKHINEK